MFYTYENGMTSVHWLLSYLPHVYGRAGLSYHPSQKLVLTCAMSGPTGQVITGDSRSCFCPHVFALCGFGVVTWDSPVTVLLFCVFISMFERIDPFSAIARAFYLISAGFMRLVGSYVVMQLIMWVIVIITVSPLSDLFIRFITSNFLMSDIEYQTIKRGFLYFMHLFSFAGDLPADGYCCRRDVLQRTRNQGSDHPQTRYLRGG